jgi:DNA-binding CsgD family transcriptional regulator
MSSQIARRVVHSFHEPAPGTDPTTALTDRENEILSSLSKGFANKEIADMLAISIPTVRTHLRHICEKLHVRSRTLYPDHRCIVGEARTSATSTRRMNPISGRDFLLMCLGRRAPAPTGNPALRSAPVSSIWRR